MEPYPEIGEEEEEEDPEVLHDGSTVYQKGPEHRAPFYLHIDVPITGIYCYNHCIQ
jgi:hypothetical protein